MLPFCMLAAGAEQCVRAQKRKPANLLAAVPELAARNFGINQALLAWHRRVVGVTGKASNVLG